MMGVVVVPGLLQCVFDAITERRLEVFVGKEYDKGVIACEDYQGNHAVVEVFIGMNAILELLDGVLYGLHGLVLVNILPSGGHSLRGILPSVPIIMGAECVWLQAPPLCSNGVVLDIASTGEKGLLGSLVARQNHPIKQNDRPH